jgi:hypothetical protein
VAKNKKALAPGFRGVSLCQRDLAIEGTSTVRECKQFDDISGTLNKWGGVRRPTCPHCTTVLGSGDVVFSPISLDRTSAAQSNVRSSDSIIRHTSSSSISGIIIRWIETR